MHFHAHKLDLDWEAYGFFHENILSLTSGLPGFMENDSSSKYLTEICLKHEEIATIKRMCEMFTWYLVNIHYIQEEVVFSTNKTMYKGTNN